MTQESQGTLDAEDLMAQELQSIRDARADDAPAPESAAPVERQEPVAEVDPAPQEPAQAAESRPETDPAEQLKATQAELHKMRSEIGRVDALNRKYMQAAQEAAALRTQLAQAQQHQAQATESKSDAASKLDAVAEQVKDFPELAGIVAAVSDALKQADKKTEDVARRVAAQVVEPLEPLRREQTERAEVEQKAAFDAAMVTFNTTYPSAVEVVKSDEFRGWLSGQPQHIQHAFQKGQTPQEAMTVLDTYDMHLRRSGKPPIAHFEQTQSDMPAQRSTPNTNRLQRAAGLPSRASGAQGGQPPADDFEASLAYFRNKRLSGNRAAA
jgi:myosin heavy subunit